MQAWTPLWTWFSTSSHTVIRRSKPLLSWTELGSSKRQRHSWLSSNSIDCQFVPRQSWNSTHQNLKAFGAVNQTDLKIPHSLLPPSRTSSHRQLQPRRKEAATLLPADSRHLWPHSPKPPTPSSMAAHCTRRGTHTWPQPLLTCQASLTCIRMLLLLLPLHLVPQVPLLIFSPRRAPQGMLQLIPPTLALWCTRFLSVLGLASSLLPAWPLLSTNTSLLLSPTLGLPEAQQFTLDTRWVLPRSVSILICSWWAPGRLSWLPAPGPEFLMGS